MGLISCNDFLDKMPESSVTPEKFFKSETDLASYAINLYGNISSISPGSYGVSTFSSDNATDNQAGVDYSSRWVPGEWKVGSNGGAWNFGAIRNCNYFLDKVLPKYDAGEIQGSKVNIEHYIGEIYFLRAYIYFSKLQELGDFPIVTIPLNDKEEELIAASKREPRNKVARFILEDLSKAIELLSETPPGGKNSISKDVAYLFRSRVALFEGTWLKYHKGTAFVPGGPGWLGKAEDVAGFDIESEIKYFLNEAMVSAKVVADKMKGNLVNNTDSPEGMNDKFESLNPYYTMFCDIDMNSYSEVLMWRKYDEKLGITHNIQMQLMRNGGGTGWTRGLVNSFLMRNGLPIYAAGSGYDPNWENQGIDATLQNRDSRIKIFTKGDNSVDAYKDGIASMSNLNWVVIGNSETRMVTGYAVKKGKHYDSYYQLNHGKGVTGSVIFRGTEAMLNYIEASYELNNTIDGVASGYWKDIRNRAKISDDFNKTIAATDMAEEAKGDFGAYSHGKLVSATLYNIRRERRNEFIGEGMRWADLKRWRSCDQIKNYQIEGMKYYGTIYENAWKDGNSGENLAIVDVEGGSGNISSKSVSGDYIRPYQITKINNSVFNGYNFIQAHYLSPIPQSVFRQTATGDKTDVSTSIIYQNPDWPMVGGEGPKM